MADIFISYSKKDVDQARLIAALLEAQGYSVWWDTSLVAGDQFRTLIMKELVAAKAVIVLWTENSITSDWVRAEANRAHSDGKLVPFKASVLPCSKIPLPFTELHTSNSSNKEAILTAVKLQLSKPSENHVISYDSTTATLTLPKVTRGHVLFWVGVTGSALVLVKEQDDVIKLSNLARWFINHASEVMHCIWNDVGSLIGISVPEYFSDIITFIFFYTMMIVGSLALSGWKVNKIVFLTKYTWLYIVILFIIFNFSGQLIGGGWVQVYESRTFLFSGVFASITLGIFASIDLPKTLGENMYTLLNIIMIGIISFMNFSFVDRSLVMLVATQGAASSIFVTLCVSLALLPLCVVPTEILFKRLSFVFVAVSIILSLSEVSKLVEHFSTIAATFEVR